MAKKITVTTSWECNNPVGTWQVAPNISNDDLLNKVRESFKMCAEQYKEAEKTRSEYDMPYVNFGEGDDYNDERSGELTLLLVEEFNVYPKVECKLAPRAPTYYDSDEYKAKEKARIAHELIHGVPEDNEKPKQVRIRAPKGHSTADKVRELIHDNPDMNQDQLVDLAISKFEMFQQKPARAKVYVRENLKKIRG